MGGSTPAASALSPHWLDLMSSSDSLVFPAPRALSQLFLSELVSGTLSTIDYLLDFEILCCFFPTSFVSVSVCVYLALFVAFSL